MPDPVFGYLALLLLLFPHGTLPSRRWRPVVWVTVGAMAVAPGDVEG